MPSASNTCGANSGTSGENTGDIFGEGFGDIFGDGFGDGFGDIFGDSLGGNLGEAVDCLLADCLAACFREALGEGCGEDFCDSPATSAAAKGARATVEEAGICQATADWAHGEAETGTTTAPCGSISGDRVAMSCGDAVNDQAGEDWHDSCGDGIHDKTPSVSIVSGTCVSLSGTVTSAPAPCSGHADSGSNQLLSWMEPKAGSTLLREDVQAYKLSIDSIVISMLNSPSSGPAKQSTATDGMTTAVIAGLGPKAGLA